MGQATEEVGFKNRKMEEIRNKKPKTRLVISKSLFW
jgi:hypothetical protein